MSLIWVEEENLYRLFATGEEGSIKQGFQLAKSLGISLESYLADVEKVYRWIYPKKKAGPAVQLRFVHGTTELSLHGKNTGFVPEQIRLIRELTRLKLTCNDLIHLPSTFNQLVNLIGKPSW